MNKEKYTKVQFKITEFDAEDVIQTSADYADIEVKPENDGGGVIGEPDVFIPFPF